MKIVCLICLFITVNALTDCDYDGTIYKSGESFPSNDGCNNCFCSNGAVACTLKFCIQSSTCKYGNTTYNDGASFKAQDGCNTCSCNNGMIACTLMFCLPDAPLLEVS